MPTDMPENIYNFSATSLDGKTVSMGTYAGKVILIVNVASKCGHTPQYAELEALYRKYKDKGLVILGFPCNQFGGQEPGSEEEIKEFCTKNYGVSFPMFSKIKVNSKDAHPIYQWLKVKAPGLLGTEAVKWNFTKFLVDSKGVSVERFASKTKVSEFEDKILSLLPKP